MKQMCYLIFTAGISISESMVAGVHPQIFFWAKGNKSLRIDIYGPKQNNLRLQTLSVLAWQ
jgi:hypothetical protein